MVRSERVATNRAPQLTRDDADAYLDRINHGPVRTPTLDVLATLQDAHVRTVPFENLDIHLSVPLSLSIDRLVKKVIERHRGGFCFELNGLFGALLRTLDFDVRLVEARHTNPDESLGPRFDHARLIVSLDGRQHLVDVGTGASPRRPLQLDVDDPQCAGPVLYRLRPDGDGHRSERLVDDSWEPDWWFDTKPLPLHAFGDRCLYHQQSPESHFTQKPLCTLVTEDGHITLSGDQLITTRRGERHTETVTDPLAVLSNRFGIDLPRYPFQ
jgi:N-hydroxyarylamine O-acetyltransferase